MNNEDTVPTRIIAIRRNGLWYAAVSSAISVGGGCGKTYEEAISKAITVFRTGKFSLDEIADTRMAIDEWVKL